MAVAFPATVGSTAVTPGTAARASALHGAGGDGDGRVLGRHVVILHTQGVEDARHHPDRRDDDHERQYSSERGGESPPAVAAHVTQRHAGADWQSPQTGDEAAPRSGAVRCGALPHGFSGGGAGRCQGGPERAEQAHYDPESEAGHQHPRVSAHDRVGNAERARVCRRHGTVCRSAQDDADNRASEADDHALGEIVAQHSTAPCSRRHQRADDGPLTQDASRKHHVGRDARGGEKEQRERY